MTVTLDGYTLLVESFEENMDAVAAEYPAWEDSSLVNKFKVYGSYRRWTLTCSELDTDWTSSAANHFQSHLESGEPVVFTVDEGDTHQVSSVNVYIRSLKITYPKGFVTASKHRRFTITIQES
ncbi:MAG: hypothetical protein QXF26_05460 [Candidatus Bathyarchaeia archaeon]